MKGSEKNLVYCCFAQKESQELISALKELKSDYNFEIESHKLGEPCNIRSDVSNKVIIFSCENENDLKKLQDEFDQNRDKLKNMNIILCCPFDCSQWKSKFDAKHVLNCSNMNNCKSEFRRIFDTVMPSVGQQKTGSFQTTGQINPQQQYQTR